MTIHTRPPSQSQSLPVDIHVLPLGEAMDHLGKLKAMSVDALVDPATLFALEIDTLENVFQARGIKLNERHLGELEAALRDGKGLDPVTLWRCGAYAFLLDGHHRLEAYRRAEKAQRKLLSIPVTWFQGSVEAAAVQAAAANTRAKLQMSSAEKSDHAWRMVLSGKFTVKQIHEAASVSPRTVKNMRKVAKELGDGAEGYASWRIALMAKQGMGAWDSEDAEALAEAMAKGFADRLAKEFSTKLAQNP